MKPRRHMIRSMSPKRAREMAKYRRLKTNFFRTHNRCACCLFPVPPQYKQIHHFYGRVSALLTYEPGFRLVHSWCHEWVETHHNEAVKLGLRAPDNLFNRPSKVIPKSP